MGASFWKPRDGQEQRPKRAYNRRKPYAPRTPVPSRWVAIRADLLAKAADMIAVADPSLARVFRAVIDTPGATVTETLGMKNLKVKP